MRVLLLGFLIINVVVCSAEVKFNALDTTDPHYAEFNAALCGYTADYIQRWEVKVQKLNEQYPALKTRSEKAEWLEDLYIAGELKKQWAKDFNNYCR